MALQTSPRAFSHIGLSVPNIDLAVKFYSDVMGWYIIMPPSTVNEEMDTAIGLMCTDVFGKGWNEFQIAHLSTADGIGIELFSFSQGIKEAPPLVLLILAFFTSVFKTQT
jgi:catechol 2,3-dioxygenase-like lactoylglutathione lyase family enzyme